MNPVTGIVGGRGCAGWQRDICGIPNGVCQRRSNLTPGGEADPTLGQFSRGQRVKIQAALTADRVGPVMAPIDGSGQPAQTYGLGGWGSSPSERAQVRRLLVTRATAWRCRTAALYRNGN
jgi:hypothetical protein